MDLVLAYLLRIAPGLALGFVLLILTRQQPRLRIIFYLALFILLRDAMTPLRLWSFGSEGFFWLRLRPDPTFLVLFGVSCGVMTVAVYFLDRANQSLFQWTRGPLIPGLLLGLAGALVVVAPMAVLYRFTPIEDRGGSVATSLLPGLIAFAVLGNLLEEGIFRGYVYGQLALWMAPMQAAITSGVVFSFCHIFLASTVTDIGLPLLAFTLWEGIIAGLVGARSGVTASTVSHGGAIFAICSGLI